MSLQLKWQYLQRTVPAVGTLMSPIEDSLREEFFDDFSGGEEVSTNLKEILVHSVKPGGIGILNSQLSANHA